MTNTSKIGMNGFVGASLLLVSLAAAINAATPDAGTEIINQAAVAYVDANGEDRVTTTNEVIITVQQVFSATIEQDRFQFGAPGQTVKYFHTLTNTGNGDDVYQISAGNDYINSAPDNGDYDFIRVYHDLDRDGIVDPEDVLLATALDTSTIRLDGGEEAALIILAGIPSGASPGDIYDLHIEAEAFNGGGSPVDGSVEDLTVGNGDDGEDDTNEDRTTVTANAVLEVTKSSVHDLGALNTTADDTITYTVTMRNVGQSNAFDVNISDVLPANVIFDNTFTITSSDVSLYTFGSPGLDGTPGSVAGPVHDGATPGEITGQIDELPPFVDVDFTYRVTLAPTVEAFDEIRNVATIDGDVDGDGSTDGPVDSNETLDTVPQIYDVVITDTGIDPSPGINDGGDDDAANDVQFVDQASGGDRIIFRHIVTNLGNGIDAFNIEIEAGERADGPNSGLNQFPPGTVFRYLHADGFTPLSDTDGDGFRDTGNLDPSESVGIVIIAILPADAEVVADTFTSVRATSTEDPAVTPVNDLTEERLAPVSPARVDIANTAAGLGDATNIHELDGNPVTTLQGESGNIVIFDLFIANEGGVDDAYVLQYWADAAATIPLSAIWTVVFKNADGDEVVATPLLDPGAVFAYTAEVTIPDTIPTPNPTDIYFRVLSEESGASDIKQDAVLMLPTESIAIQSDQSTVIQPCGQINYDHRITNTGQTDEDVLIEVLSQTELAHTLWYPTAHDGTDITGYTPKSALSVGDSVAIYDASAGAYVFVVLIDAAGELAIPMDAGDLTFVRVFVSAPCDTPLNTVDTLVIQAEYVDAAGSDPVINTDITTVSNVNVTIDKLGALDSNCDDVPEGTFDVATVIASPGDCVIWQMVVRNHHTTNVCGVEVHDRAPEWTEVYNSGPTPLPSVVASPGLTGPSRCAITGSNIDCNVGDDFDIDGDGTLDPFCLLSGQSATVWFSVRVD